MFAVATPLVIAGTIPLLIVTGKIVGELLHGDVALPD
jgi:hypothetical protein